MNPKTIRFVIQSSDSGFTVIGESPNSFRRLASGMTDETLQALLQQSIRHCHKRGVSVEVRNESTGAIKIYPVKKIEIERV